MPPVAAAAVAIAAGFDLAFAEPPARVHPVAAFGRVVGRLDRHWSHPRSIGLLAAVVLPLGTAALAGAATSAALHAHPALGAAVAGFVLLSTTSLRMLVQSGRQVARESETDLLAARRGLPALAGRDPDALSAGQVRSAAVESLAENLADGLVGPLLAFALLAPLSLGLAAGAAAWVKAVNTMDSMLGYRGKPVGWAAALLDDLLMWIPARLSAALLCLVAGTPAAFATARRWADRPASPNSGWPMSAMAAILQVRLEKPGGYVLNPDAALPSVADAKRAADLTRLAGGAAFVGAGVLAWA